MSPGISAHEHHHAEGPLKLLVDGSVTPEQIPDSVAYDNWFLAVCESRTPTSAEASRQLAKVAAIRLNADDLRTLTAALANFKQQFQAISDQRSKLGANATGQFSALQTAEANLVAVTKATLQTGLSPGGWAALDQYIQSHVKQHIKVYTEPGTTAAGGGGN